MLHRRKKEKLFGKVFGENGVAFTLFVILGPFKQIQNTSSSTETLGEAHSPSAR
jgi:hypothetical protein